MTQRSRSGDLAFPARTIGYFLRHTNPPLSLSSADPAELHAVTRLYFDIDDTVTWRGQLPPEAASALYCAADAGLQLVAVTGRSFAWAEMLMRLFALAGAVAETGACALWRLPDGRLQVVHHEPDVAVRADNARLRKAAADVVCAQFPHARLAMDNVGRLYDTAFDLVEDGPAIGADVAAQMRALLHARGLVTAQSSVHINAWCLGPHGTFDKATMVDRVLRTFDNIDLDTAAKALCYVGDSSNDGAMFARAGISVGVANVSPSLDALMQRGEAPRFTVDKNGGAGFAQVVQTLVDARRGR